MNVAKASSRRGSTVVTSERFDVGPAAVALEVCGSFSPLNARFLLQFLNKVRNVRSDKTAPVSTAFLARDVSRCGKCGRLCFDT